MCLVAIAGKGLIGRNGGSFCFGGGGEKASQTPKLPNADKLSKRRPPLNNKPQHAQTPTHGSPWPKDLTPPDGAYADGLPRAFYFIGVKKKLSLPAINLQAPVAEFKAQASGARPGCRGSCLDSAAGCTAPRLAALSPFG